MQPNFVFLYVSKFSIIISVFILLEVCHDSDLTCIVETRAKWYTGQNDKARKLLTTLYHFAPVTSCLLFS